MATPLALNLAQGPTAGTSATLAQSADRLSPASQANLPPTITRGGWIYAKQFDPSSGKYFYLRMRPAPTATTATAAFATAQPRATAPVTKQPTTGFGDIMAKLAPVTPQAVSQLVQQSVGLSEADKSALARLRASDINYEDYERNALTELTPYYERLLKDVNYDIDLAVKQLEQSYQLGLRQSREIAGTTLREQEPTFRTEREQQLASLNQRGLLSTVTGPLETVSAIAPDTGEKIGGERIQGFGGLAGARIGILRQSQQARAEAIQRALARQEESASMEREQTKELQERSRQKQIYALEQEKRERVPTLAQSKYQRELQKTQLKREEILSPYG